MKQVTCGKLLQVYTQTIPHLKIIEFIVCSRQCAKSSMSNHPYFATHIQVYTHTHTHTHTHTPQTHTHTQTYTLHPQCQKHRIIQLYKMLNFASILILIVSPNHQHHGSQPNWFDISFEL